MKNKKTTKEIEQKGLLFLCEMGLDPGIDHMSAMKIINQVKKEGGKLHLSNRIAEDWYHLKVMIIPGTIKLPGTLQTL